MSEKQNEICKSRKFPRVRGNLWITLGSDVVWWIMFHTRICEVKHLRLHSSFGNYSLPTRFNCLSEQEVGCLEGHISLSALQSVPCPSTSCEGGEGHGRLVCLYTVLGL